MSEDKQIKKVIKVEEGLYEPDLKYCNQVENTGAKSFGLCPEFGGQLHLPAPKSIKAETQEEAEKILDRDLTKIMDNIVTPEMNSRKACAECEIFDRCWKMKIYGVLESIQYNIDVKQQS